MICTMPFSGHDSAVQIINSMQLNFFLHKTFGRIGPSIAISGLLRKQSGLLI